MDQATLVGLDIEAGRRILRYLDEASFKVSAAFWLFSSERQDWRLWIATPLVDKAGKRDAYLRLGDILRTTEPELLIHPVVHLVSPKEKLIRSLRRIFGKTASVEGMRLGNNLIDGTFIEDAYVYRIR
ncbi:MAG TPA: hypothetical protein VK687_12705 [Bryobacteraceae bacterium]|jgi:hypothetical protein|nr:hypothetical protein [Bryobacteraceae bacterium]